MALLTHLLAIAAGALVTWWFLRGQARLDGETKAIAPNGDQPVSDRMLEDDPDLDSRIIELVSSTRVFHINDVCQRLEHPKGSRFVRAHFHRLMDLGHIRYRDLRYQV